MSKTVLIVDDSRYIRAMVASVLTKEGFIIVGEAEMGATAIDMAKEFKPDLITLDNVLPDMLGLDVLKELKGVDGFSSKVVFMSAVDQDSVIKEGEELGADGYIVKPFTPEKIIEEIGKVLGA